MSQNEPVMSQRERFEKICGSFPFCMPMHTYIDGGYRDTDAKRSWAIWQAACPEGFVALPVELIDWIERAQTLMRALPDSSGWPDTADKAKSLLSAAPKPESAGKREKQWRVVEGRHHKCGGSVSVLCKNEQPPGLFMHGSPIVCKNCGKEGEVYAEDGGIEFVWYRKPEDACKSPD
jgi:hypothetical protein